MAKRTEITILSENTVGPSYGLLAEHGFSAFIQRDGVRILFDLGQGHVLLNNATRLGIDLRLLELIVISHGHWDHTGGLWDVLVLKRGETQVYCHPGIFSERYIVEAGKRRYTGIPFSKTSLEAVGARFEMNQEPREIGDGIWLTGEIPRKSSFEKGAGNLLIRKGDRVIPDDIIDEQSLIIHGTHGLIIVLGCAHPGMINTIEHAIQLTGVSDIEAIVGGTHMMYLDEDQVESSLAALKGFKPRLVATSHCTGERANARIRREFPTQFVECHAGRILNLD